MTEGQSKQGAAQKKTGKRIIVDWGTSNFRAYRFVASGEVVEVHQAACGILSVESGAFEATLLREIGGWITPESEIYLSGMITSRNGWLETPYIEVPADLADIKAQALVSRLQNGARMLFLPGICQRSPTPDVMRGEEIQVFGTLAPDEDATLILPGTHSKWVRTEKGRLTAFRTFMTGEVFALLKAHSILGRLVPGEAVEPDTDAFVKGVRRANDAASAGLLHEIFTTRSGVLLGQLDPGEIAETLSGLVIGAEIAGGIALGWTEKPLVLVGDGALCTRYALAMKALGLSSRIAPPQATVEGFRRLAALEGTNP